MRATWDVEDELFGPIEIGLDREAGRVTVRGPRIPAVVVRRSGEPIAEHVPIGTRDPAALAMSVGGVAAGLRPSPGRLARRSYRVLAHLGGSALLSSPCAPEHSRIVRGGVRPSRQRQMGIAERRDDGSVSITWHDEVTTTGWRTVRASKPTPAEAAVAYAMAAAFGTGARMMLPVLFDVLLFAPI